MNRYRASKRDPESPAHAIRRPAVPLHPPHHLQQEKDGPTADCGCILTLYLILCRRCAPCSTNSTPATDEIGTLTKRTSDGCTQHRVLCATNTCPITLTSVRDREWYPVARKRAFEGFVIDLCRCHICCARRQPEIRRSETARSLHQQMSSWRSSNLVLISSIYLSNLSFTYNVNFG